MSADKKEPQAQSSGCGLGLEQIDRAVGKDRSRPAMTSIEPGEPILRVRIARRTDGVTPEQWDARIQTASLVLARVLLRTRERLLAEGKLPRHDA